VVREEESVTVDREQARKVAKGALYLCDVVDDLRIELNDARADAVAAEMTALALEAEQDRLRGEVERLREVAVTAWTDLFGGEPGEAVAKQLWDAVVSAVAGKEQSS
jgi:hypothetical protein